MAGSETGVMTSSGRMEPFGVSHQKNQQPAIQNMRLAFGSEGSAVYRPVNTAPAGGNNNHYQPPSSTPVAGSVGGVMEGSGSGTVPSHEINMNSSGGGGEVVKRKRGRPRKYGPDGSMASVSLALVSPPPAQTVTQPQQPPPPQQPNGGGGFASSPSPTATTIAGCGVTVAPVPPPPQISVGSAPAQGIAPVPSPVSPCGTTITKKARGRPPGSSNKKHHVEAMGSTGFGFTPHIITVKAGEDVSSQIMSFSQHGPRAICVLSANGAISNVTLRQSSTSGGTVTYEGRFEILSLSGSFMPSEIGGHWSRTGGLSVALSGSDGRVLGGSVAGLLIAATPIQLVVASFISDGDKDSRPFHYVESLTAMGRLNPVGGPTGPSSPPSRGTHSESSGGPGSPIHQNSGAYNSHPQGISSMPWK